MGWFMQKVNKPYVHDVVNALSQVVIEVLVAGGGDAEEGGTGEVVSKHSCYCCCCCEREKTTLDVGKNHL